MNNDKKLKYINLVECLDMCVDELNKLDQQANLLKEKYKKNANSDFSSIKELEKKYNILLENMLIIKNQIEDLNSSKK